MTWDATGHHLKANNPKTGVLIAAKNDFAGIETEDFKKEFEFRAEFRAQGGDAADLSKINSVGVLNYLKSNNGHDITGEQAGKIYNNG